MSARDERRQRSEQLHGLVTRLKRGKSLGLVSRLLDRVPLHAIALTQFYVLEAMGGPQMACVRGAGEVRPGTAEDAPGMGQLEGKAPSKFLSRFDRGDQCLVAVSRGAVVGYEWFSEHRPFVEERTTYPVLVPRDAIFAYDGFVHPAYRSRGTFIRLQAGSVDLMHQRGAGRIVTAVDMDNEASLSAHLRLGFKPLYAVQAFRVMGYHYYRERKLG